MLYLFNSQEEPANTDEFEMANIQQRNKVMDEIVKKSKKHKKEKKSLLELHREKLKKKKVSRFKNRKIKFVSLYISPQSSTH